MLARLLLAMLALVVTVAAPAQDRKRIDKAADLPRFSYRIDGKLEDVIRDDARFAALAREVRRDTESVLAQYDIADKAELRRLLGVLVQLDYLDGRYDDALKTAARVRELQEKPAEKLLSGLQLRAQVAALRKTGSTTSDAYRQEVGRAIAAELAGMPYATIANDVKGSKARAETLGEAVVLGNLRNVLQPTVTRAGALSSDLVPGVIGTRYALLATLPLKATLVDTYGAYLAAHKVEKPDIWAARDVALPEGRGYAPVVIAIWDSGVDAALFPGRAVMAEAGKPAGIAFDRFGDPATDLLYPIPAALKDRLPTMKARIKGFSDLRANVDSPEASEVKQYLSTLDPDRYKGAMEEIRMAGNYAHGTHVAGIAVAGNPYVRLVTARIDFGYTLLPDPCPSKELALKEARNFQSYVDFMKSQRVRVANMSWGGSVKGYERALELCAIGKDTAERTAIAREHFEIARKALVDAMASAPEILFVASAGNANQDSTFAEAYPSSIVLPNVVTVGAVDKAGDEAPFTSYGPTVVLHANGYQVDSYIPGGDRVAQSGTSMSAPQVTNLAAKMLAVNPKLTPVDLIAIMRATAEKTEDGRRILVDPKKAVAAAEARRS